MHQNIYTDIHVCANITNMNKIYTKHQAAAARPGPEAPGPAGTGRRCLVFCICVVNFDRCCYVFAIFFAEYIILDDLHSH